MQLLGPTVKLLAVQYKWLSREYTRERTCQQTLGICKSPSVKESPVEGSTRIEKGKPAMMRFRMHAQLGSL